MANALMHKQVAGFTLVEMTVVLVIVGLLLGGLLLPLSAQIDQRNYVDTENVLNDYKEALLGYAASHTAVDGNPYLVCPDTNSDGTENREADGSCTSQEGDAPWSTLGLKVMDNWSNVYRYRVTPAFSNSTTGFTLSSTGNINILDASGGNTIASQVPAIVVSKGKNGAAASPDETENSDGDGSFVSHVPSNSAGSEFDDLSVWIPPSILFNRMIMAGKLP